MALNLDDRYPGRAGGKTLDYPQGSFKNRTSPNAQDGTFLEQDWANDMLAFFQALMSNAGMTANNVVDTARASQYFDALVKTIRGQAIPGATFAELDAATADQGPAICTDMGGYLYKWVETAYFSGYRNVRIGEMPDSFATITEPWWMPMTGGVWSEADPKQRRLIAWFREQGQVMAAIDWAKGWGRIADLGGGDWKAVDAQDGFKRWAGTDRDTANPMGPGEYQADAVQRITGSMGNAYGSSVADAGALYGTASDISGTAGAGATVRRINFDSGRSVRTSTETRVAGPRTLPVVLI